MPQASMSVATVTSGYLEPADNMTYPGAGGFFSYAMNIDLKRGTFTVSEYAENVCPAATDVNRVHV